MLTHNGQSFAIYTTKPTIVLVIPLFSTITTYYYSHIFDNFVIIYDTSHLYELTKT